MFRVLPGPMGDLRQNSGYQDRISNYILIRPFRSELLM